MPVMVQCFLFTISNFCNNPAHRRYLLMDETNKPKKSTKQKGEDWSCSWGKEVGSNDRRWLKPLEWVHLLTDGAESLGVGGKRKTGVTPKQIGNVSQEHDWVDPQNTQNPPTVSWKPVEEQKVYRMRK